MFNCKNLRIRQKNYSKYYWCKSYKKAIILSECENCSNRTLKPIKPIKKVNKKRVVVKDETYNKVYERDRGCCRVCGSNEIELHHIKYRSEDKSLINDINNCILLCGKHHRKVHSNKDLYQWQLLEQVNSGKRIILKEKKDE